MTIEERADAYVGYPEEIDEFTSETIKRAAYIRGAKEQKAIDDAELLRLKSSWEREAQINHNDENNYKQGFHDAIEKACEWLDNYLMEIGYPDDWLRDSINIKSGKERFRKAMEK